MHRAAWIGKIIVLTALLSSQVSGQNWTITGVTVVDLSHGRLLRNVNVTISHDRIVAVGNAAGPALVNGTGKYLIPGLWDMHGSRVDADTVGVYLAHGITGVREMSTQPLDRTLALYHDIEAGRIAGPRLLTAGIGIRAASPDEARTAFDRVFDTDADFIRFHKDLDYESYIALAERARKWRYALVGPMPLSVRLRDVLALRQASIEGLEGLDRLTRDEACEGFRSADIAGTWFTPLLASQMRSGIRSTARKAVALVRLMQECGAPMLAGGDSAGLIDELEALVEHAGFTPLDALRTATVEPARFLGRADKLGEVAPGHLADLLLLDANPLDDIANLRRVAGVFVRGRYLNTALLSALRRPPTMRGWPVPVVATRSVPQTPAASSVKPPASSAKPASPTR